MLLKIDKRTNISSILGDVELFFKNHKINKIKKMEVKTIISEVIYNIQKYTPKGSVRLSATNDTLHITALDHGTGIDNINMAIQDGYSSSGTLGLGFASIFRLSDEVEISTSENGTIIDITKRLK